MAEKRSPEPLSIYIFNLEQHGENRIGEQQMYKSFVNIQKNVKNIL